MTFSRIALCAALVSGLLVAGGSTASAECETVSVDVYDLQLDVGRKTYHVGDTARVDATVTRTDTGTAVDGAMFGVIVVNSRKKAWIAGFDETDANGRATGRLKLDRKGARLGPAHLHAVAYKEAVNVLNCAQVVEYGHKRVRNAFTIKP